MASSAYLPLLPQVFRAPRPDGTDPFLGDFLKVFEALLSGRADANAIGIRGLEDLVARFPEFIDPARAPVDEPLAPVGEPLPSRFLDYLASWTALILDQNWPIDKRREWVRRIVPLYGRRGTRAALQEYLATFVGADVFVRELPGGFILADDESSTLGVDTFIAGAPEYYFRVGINYAFSAPFTLTGWLNVQRGTRAIIDLEKPAHTYYHLLPRTPGFVLARPGHTVLGAESLLWSASIPFET